MVSARFYEMLKNVLVKKKGGRDVLL